MDVFVVKVAFLGIFCCNAARIGFLFEHSQQEYVKNVESLLNNMPQIEEEIIIFNEQNTREAFNAICSSGSNGFSALIDFSHFPLPEIEKTAIPYFKMKPAITPFLSMLAAYLKARSATDVALILQNERDLGEAINHLASGFPFRAIAFNGRNDSCVDRLKRLRPAPSYYAIVAATEEMSAIFEKLIKKDAFQRPDKWHLLFMDDNHDAFQFRDVAGSAFKLIFQRSIEWKRVSFFEIVVKEVLEQLTSHHLPLRVLKCDNISVGALNANFDLLQTSQYLRVEGKNEVVFNLDVLIVSSTSKEEENQTVTYRDGKLQGLLERVHPARRFFRVGIAESIPWAYIRRDSRGNAFWDGYCIDLISKLSEMLSFDYELVHPKCGTFGRRHSDGHWDGIVGDLVTGETDLAVAGLKLTAEREEVIDFIVPYYDQTGISIVMRKAVRQTSLFKFMTVLRVEVWLSIGAVVVATSTLIWLLDKYSPYSSRNNKAAYPYPCREFSYKESIWFTLTSLTPQGGGETPKSVSGRVLVAAYWLFVTLMLATFTANLAAFLTVERLQTPVQSLEQLARQSRINYTVVKGSDTHKYFINMNFAEETLYRLWRELALNATSDQSQFRIWDYPIKEQYAHILLSINSSNPVHNASEGFRMVNENDNADYAFIHDSAEIKYEISRNCNLTEVGEVFALQPYAIAVQQGSHLQDEISYAILELQKDRYFEGLTAKYWNYSANPDCSGSKDTEGIALESLGGVFIATLFGLALSMITLVGEVFYHKRKFFKNIKTVKPKLTTTLESDSKGIFRGKEIPLNITFGDKFVPVAQKPKKDSTYID